MAAHEKNSVKGEWAVPIRNAFFIKLGRGGKWEKDSIDRGLMRIGWHEIPLAEINAGKWKDIERRIRKDMADPGAAKRDLF